jgi:hypothetical protein
MKIKSCYQSLALTLLLLVGCAGNATAATQTPQPQNPREVFDNFFNSMLGVWECNIREWSDPAKPPVWEDRQIRRFERILRDRFIQEWAYVNVRGAKEPVAAGIHLTSYNPRSGKVYQSGYWAQAAGRLFEFEGAFDKSGRRIDGVMTVRRDDGALDKRRVEIEWQGQNKHIYRVFKQLPSGTEYLHEEFVYTRKST